MVNDYLHSYTWDTPENTGIMILSAAEYRTNIMTPSSRTVMPYWVLDYSIEDIGYVRIGSTKSPWIERKKGLAHIYAPRTPYWEDYSNSCSTRHAAYVCFQKGEIAGLEKFFTGRQRYARIVDSNSRILQLLHNMAMIGEKYGASGIWKAQSELYKLIDLLLTCEKQDTGIWQIKTDDTQPVEEDLAYAVRSYLARHIDEPISLPNIAQHVGVSLSTLSHRYREQTGETPLHTHLAMRIEKIKHLLRMGTPLKTIAAQMGFSDIYHVSKTFSHAVGVSPRGFIKMDRSSKPTGAE